MVEGFWKTILGMFALVSGLVIIAKLKIGFKVC